jgi:hypothetical protein
MVKPKTKPQEPYKKSYYIGVKLHSISCSSYHNGEFDPTSLQVKHGENKNFYTNKECQFGHVGYLFIDFSCGTIKGIQSLLIGVFIYVSMTIDVFAIVLVLNFLSNS